MNGLVRSCKHLTLTGLLALMMQTPLLAAPGTLATTPLYLSTAVEPNIVFVNDDSTSMDMGFLVKNYQSGYGFFYSYPYYTYGYYPHPVSDNLYIWSGSVVPTEGALLTAGVPQASIDGMGVWRSWNADYNKIYYNPAITYNPWSGVDGGGTAYADANPAAARNNPYDTNAANVTNLTTTTSYFSYYYMYEVPSIPGTDPFTGLPALVTSCNTPYTTYCPVLIPVLNFNPARYYQWTDSNGNGTVDGTDTHTLVEIEAVTPTYTGSANRVDCAAAPTCTYAEELQNFANWFSYYRKREFVSKAAISAVVATVDNARVGYATINDNNATEIAVASMNTDVATGNKRLLLDELFQTDSTIWTTPLRTALEKVGRYYECKSNSMFNSSAGVNCPILPAASGGICQQNYTILVSDGDYNGVNPGITAVNADGDGNTNFDGGSYADTWNLTLADVAMDYYERDLGPTMADQVNASGVDTATHQHMVTFTVGFGIDGTLDPFDTKTPGVATDTDPTATGFAWPEPTWSYPKFDDLWHAAYNGRGKYLSAQDPTELTSAFTTAVSAIADRTSSAAAVAFNSTTLGTGSMVYLAQFNTTNWKGNLFAYALDPFTGDVASNASWTAADALDAQPHASRTIITFNNDPAVKDGVAFRTLGDLSAAQQADLNMGPSGAADGFGQDRLDYLRGDRSDEGAGRNFRTRSSVLGDIVQSNPVYVGLPLMNYPDELPFGTGADAYSTFKTTYVSRQGVIYVGANDGMLHGFRETDGEEVLAYVPSSVYSSAAANTGLHYLTDPNYSHRYYVDLSPTVSDVRLNGVWRTVLIGGLRGGGPGLFALDITDPSTFSEANAANIALWEFNSSHDNDLGYTYSKPTIVLTNAVDGSGNNRWAAILGNGYNSPDNGGSGTANLFILFLDGGLDGTWTAGTDYIELSTGVGTAVAANGLSTPAVVDLDGDGTGDRVYAGDLLGNLWAFDLSNSSTAQWGSAYKQGSTPKPLFTATDAGGTPQPITTKPVAATHPSQTTVASNEPNLLIYVGTGQFIVNADKANTATQSMYGIWDEGTKQLTRSNLQNQTFLAGFAADTRVLSDNAVNWGTKNGWYIDLPTAGERVAVNPKVRGEFVLFNTLIPDSTACSYGGSGWLMAVKQENGGRPDDPVFDINNDGQVNSNDQQDLSGTAYAAGGIQFSEGIPAESNFLSGNQYTPGSSGDLEKNKIDTGDHLDQGRLSWQELRP